MHQDALTRRTRRGSRRQYFVVHRVKRSADLQPVGTRSRMPAFRASDRWIRLLLVRVHVSERLPFTQRQKDFLVVPSGVVGRIDHEETKLAGVAPRCRSSIASVCECTSRTRRLSHELIAPTAMWGHRRRAFFRAPSTSEGTNKPCQCTYSGTSVSFTTSTATRCPLAPAARDRDLVAVADGADHHLRSQLDRHGRDLQGEIRRAGGLRFEQRRYRALWRRWDRPRR